MPALVYEPLECSRHEFHGKENNKIKAKPAAKEPGQKGYTFCKSLF